VVVICFSKRKTTKESNFIIVLNVIGLSGAVMPGPLLTVNITASLRRGAVAGPIVVFGHAIAEIGILLAIYFGLSSLVSRPQVFWWIAVLGGAVLILLGAIMIADLLRRKVRLELAGSANYSDKRLVLLGGLVSVSSPYWILWWVTVGTLLISQSLAFGVIGLVVFYFGHILSDLAWYSVVSILVARGKKYVNNALYQSLIAICALFLVALGIYFIQSAVSGAFLEYFQNINQ